MARFVLLFTMGCYLLSFENQNVLADDAAVAAAKIWDLETLSKVPKTKWLDSSSPIRSLTYEGEAYRGKRTQVFAFYATPSTLNPNAPADKDLPAVVLVHGGGGTAFAEWVELWASRGYAAIAMNLSGRQPASPRFADGKLIANHAVGSNRLEFGGPEQTHEQIFRSIDAATNEHWSYHAVVNVILAHSLIRSFDEVDAERTAVTGISWGGYTTCIAASVDHRFKAAVPVYGCGFLYDGDSVQKPEIDGLPGGLREKWIRRYDPSSHLARCRVPIFFVNGTNDVHYPLPSYSRSFGLVPGQKQMRIEVNMHHSHEHGWAPEEIGFFIDSQINNGPLLPTLEAPSLKSGVISFTCESQLPLASAALHYTEDNGTLSARKWKSVPAAIEGNVIKSSQLPDDATIWFLSVTDNRGAMVSTDLTFANASESGQ